jgi:hypothetical protein
MWRKEHSDGRRIGGGGGYRRRGVRASNAHDQEERKGKGKTARYAHLRDDTLKKAANVPGRINAEAETVAKKTGR